MKPLGGVETSTARYHPASGGFIILLLALLSLAAVAAAASPQAASAQTSPPPATSQLIVTSQSTAGASLDGYYTVLFQNGAVAATGFTPTAFTLSNGVAYVVQADDYSSCHFDRWADGGGGTSASRTISITTNTQVVAVYACGGSSSSVTVSSVDQHGRFIFGYYAALYDSGGRQLASGFTTKTFPTEAGQTYFLQADGYAGCAFSHWSNGDTGSRFSFTATGGSLPFTAVFDCSGPALMQQSGSTCSHYCYDGSASTSFASPVTAGDMLVVTVVNDNETALQVSDSLGTAMTQAVNAVDGPMCGGELVTCQAEIYWGILPSSGPDTVTVSEGSYQGALRVQAWEFSGVDAVQYAVDCTPDCPATTFPSGSVLLATARGDGTVPVNGGGPGFTFYPYEASYLAGSEYQVTAAPGSTTFPFSTSVREVEAAAVLVEKPGNTSTVTVSTVDLRSALIYGYHVSLWHDGEQVGSCFSTCSFTVNDGQTYQVEAASYGAETFSHWQNDGATGRETVDVPGSGTVTISLTAVYSP
ncbi:MAG: hypothetical protein ABSF83_00385 [Nitrososphaerales archaeon]|jgi:hypothetical protein